MADWLYMYIRILTFKLEVDFSALVVNYILYEKLCNKSIDDQFWQFLMYKSNNVNYPLKYNVIWFITSRFPFFVLIFISAIYRGIDLI